MSRPRKVTDDDIFGATYRLMSRVGPADLTLAAIASEAGVTAGALVQRFGSKHQLQVALASRVADSAGDMIREIEATARSPLAAIREYADCLAALASSPGALLRNLAYLQADLSDPDLRRHLLTQARATRGGLAAIVARAVKAGELKAATDPATLARTIEAVLSGSMMSWAAYRDGPAVAWMRDDLEAVLAPYLVRRRARR